MKTVLEALLHGDSFEWADAVDALAPIRYEWMSAEQMPAWADGVATGSRYDVAFALLLIPGAIAVGIADQNDDPRIEPYMVELCLRWDPRSMTDEPLDDSNWNLLEAEVQAQLYEHLPAGVGYRCTYDLVRELE